MKHITAALRGKIEILHQLKYTNTAIAKELGYHPSTISREIRKGVTEFGHYQAYVAEAATKRNRARCKQTPILERLSSYPLRSYVVEGLQRGWDPAVIAGRLRLESRQRSVCAETIYRWIYTSAWARNECLYQYLRLGKKRRTKQRGRSTQRSRIPNRVSIHKRPAVAAAKTHLGHWEGDSVLYAHKQAITTINDLASSLVLLTKATQKTAYYTTQALTAMLSSCPAKHPDFR